MAVGFLVANQDNHWDGILSFFSLLDGDSDAN